MMASGPEGDRSGCHSNCPGLRPAGLLPAAAGFFDAGFFDGVRLRAARASVAKKFPLINTLAPVSKIPTAARRLKRMKPPPFLAGPAQSRLQHRLSKRRESM